MVRPYLHIRYFCSLNCQRVVYNLVQGQVSHLKGLPVDADHLASEGIEGSDEETPLLDPVANVRPTQV